MSLLQSMVVEPQRPGCSKINENQGNPEESTAHHLAPGKGISLSFQQDNEWPFLFFKTAGFNPSPTPPRLFLTQSLS